MTRGLIRTVSTPAATPWAPMLRTTSRVLLRKCACGGSVDHGDECESCRRKRPLLQRRFASYRDEEPEVPALVYDVVQSPGAPLDERTRTQMEQQFRHDFSRVRVHTDTKAAESARAVNAHAYTVGDDVVFAGSHYEPHTTAGQLLLAHELAHVVQQRSVANALQPMPVVAVTNNDAEREADAAATRVVAGLAVPPITRQPMSAVQRQERPRDAGTGEAERALTRSEEIELSLTSPGGIAGTARPPVISLYNFGIDQASLKERHTAALREVRDLIGRVPAANLHVLVVGHADSSGSPAANGPLSQRRAQAVQSSLQGAGGHVVDVGWAGDRQPAVPNDTVDGRSRNRRVDIHLLPRGPQPSRTTDQGGDQPPTPGQPPPPPQDDPWFCEQHPIICVALGLGAAGAALLWFCIQNPSRCLPERRPREPRGRRACPTSVRLPSGTHRADPVGPILGDQYWLKWPFAMDVRFRHEQDGECDCGCGEYKQTVKGFAERIQPDGTVTPSRLPLVGGPIDRTTEREDSRGGHSWMPYGHRFFDDPTRQVPRPNQDEDSFNPDRETGCHYVGGDEPGMTGNTPGQRMRFEFNFRGGPVDACRTRAEIGSWSSWTVSGDFTIPGGAPPPPPPPPTPTPTPTPRGADPDRGPSIGPARERAEPSVFCWGGSISCEASNHLQRRNREHIMLTEDDVREAIDIEHRVLMATRRAPLIVDPHQFEERQIWVMELRREARRRVLDFAQLSRLEPSGYAR